MDSSSSSSNNTFPHRVIYVDATLSNDNAAGRLLFCQPTSWDFHIISHTRSRDVRNLSRAVAKQSNCYSKPIFNSENKIIKDRYKDAFEAIDWHRPSDELIQAYEEVLGDKNNTDGASEAFDRDQSTHLVIKSYQAIREFLQILYHNDGVRMVWLDAICINQASQQEKEQEIPFMADFYKRSKACYVLMNGFGGHAEQGSTGQLLVNDYKLPLDRNFLSLRWFNRVWTLQELLLPTELYFIVELESWFGELVNGLMKGCGKGFFCECDIKRARGTIDLCDKIEQFLRSGKGNSCARCMDSKLFVKELVHPLHEQRHLYRIDRNTMITTIAHLIPLPSGYCKVWRFQNLVSLVTDQETRVKIKKPKILAAIVKEIRCRECDEINHPEDRILGMLGLLNLKNKGYKITAQKKSPEEQIVELASQGVFTDETVMEICELDPHYGRNLKGVSWIPDFTQHPKISWNTCSEVHRLVAKDVRVLKDGHVTFKTCALQAKFKNNHSFELHVKSLLTYVIAPKAAGEPKDGQFVFNLNQKDGMLWLPFPLDLVNKRLLISNFEVWIIPIFSDGRPRNSPPFRTTSLICLKDCRRPAESHLHKIGILETQLSFKLESINNLKEVTIGGYGPNMTF